MSKRKLLTTAILLYLFPIITFILGAYTPLLQATYEHPEFMPWVSALRIVGTVACATASGIIFYLYAPREK